MTTMSTPERFGYSSAAYTDNPIMIAIGLVALDKPDENGEHNRLVAAVQAEEVPTGEFVIEFKPGEDWETSGDFIAAVLEATAHELRRASGRVRADQPHPGVLRTYASNHDWND
jgi:hypothetical protein